MDTKTNVEAVDVGQLHDALVVDADVVRLGATGEQLVEANGVGLQ